MFMFVFALYFFIIFVVFFFFFNDTATTEIYTLSLHDALPISSPSQQRSTSSPSPSSASSGQRQRLCQPLAQAGQSGLSARISQPPPQRMRVQRAGPGGQLGRPPGGGRRPAPEGRPVGLGGGRCCSRRRRSGPRR